MHWVGLTISATGLACFVQAEESKDTPKWSRLECALESSVSYSNPVQEATLPVRFTAPSGNQRVIPGFGDGGRVWRVRFCPDETGEWTYRTECSAPTNAGVNLQTGRFRCVAPTSQSPCRQHGPLRLSEERRYLAHADSGKTKRSCLPVLQFATPAAGDWVLVLKSSVRK